MTAKLSFLTLLILGVLAKNTFGQYRPMLSNVTNLVNSSISNGLGNLPALGLLVNSLAMNQRLSPNMLQNVNITSIVNQFDQYSQDFLTNNCDKTNSYYDLLLSLKNTTSYRSLFTLDRIRPLLACRKDCRFYPLFSDNLTVNHDTALFLARNLPRKLAKMCSSGLRQMLGFQPDVLNTTNTSNMSNVPSVIYFIKNNPAINLEAVLSPVKIRRLSQQDAMDLIGNLTSQTTLTPDMTKELGKYVPKNKSLSEFMKIASGIPMNLIENASLSDLLSCLTNCDLSNFDSARVGRLVRSILKRDNSASTLRALAQTNSFEVLNALPADVLSTMDLSGISPANLPPNAQRVVAKNTLLSNNLSNIGDLTDFQKILPVLPISKLENVSGSDILVTYSRMLAANQYSTSNLLSSTQRSNMLQNVIKFAMNKTGLNSPEVIFASMNETVLEAYAELFIEANETDISNLAKQKQSFQRLIAKLAQIPEKKCTNYRSRSRGLLARYAISNLAQNPNSPTESDLDMLGPCLASALPASILSSITSTVLFNRIMYFSGPKFQPDAQTAQAFSNKLSSIAQLDAKNNQAEFLSDLGDSIVFYPNIGSIDKETMWMYGQQWLESAKETRNPSNQQVQDYRLGVPDASSLNTMFMAAQSAMVQSIKAKALSQMNTSGSRKKRSTTATTPQFTCDDCSAGKICLETYSNLVCQFSINDLAMLSNSDMMQCLSILGSSSDCSQKNLTDIANLVLSRLYSNNASNISDSSIQDMNQLVQGMTPDQIGKLNIQSIDTIAVIGQLSSFSGTQLQNVMMPVRQFLGGNFNSDSLISIGNLACGLNDTDVQMVSTADFNASLPLLSGIQNTAGNCSGAYPLYNRTRQILGASNLLTPDNLAMIGSIAGGMPPADARNLSQDATAAILPSAFDHMQVGSLANIVSNNLNALTTEQLSSITSSDVYSSLPSSLQSSLNTEIDSTGSTTTSTSSSRRPGSNVLTMLALVLSTIIALSFSLNAN